MVNPPPASSQWQFSDGLEPNPVGLCAYSRQPSESTISFFSSNIYYLMIILKHNPNISLKICCFKCFFSPLANILFPWQEEQRELAQCWKTENQFSVTEVTKNSLKNLRNLRTGSGFARTNLALVLWTRSRGDAHGGEIDISRPPISLL